MGLKWSEMFDIFYTKNLENYFFFFFREKEKQMGENKKYIYK